MSHAGCTWWACLVTIAARIWQAGGRGSERALAGPTALSLGVMLGQSVGKACTQSTLASATMWRRVLPSSGTAGSRAHP